MGKIVVVLLSIFAVVVCGFSIPSQDQKLSPINLKSNTSTVKRELPKGFRPMVEKFYGDFNNFKSSLVEFSANFAGFHRAVMVNASFGEGEESGETGPQKYPDLRSLLSSCSDLMKFFPSPRPAKQLIYPYGNGSRNGNKPSQGVLCDFETDGGGWTIIQKRSRGPLNDFDRNWTEYVNGFGSLNENGNFWLGLENIHALTQNGDQELRIELEDFEGEQRWAKYSHFSISDASDFYRLSISGFSENSTALDSMTEHDNGTRFSTKDKDNDNYSDGNCAIMYPGGWWFNYCSLSNLNGLYFERREVVPGGQGVHWWRWKGDFYSLAKTEMKIRPRKF